MVSGTFYYTTLRHVLPEFRLPWFILTIFAVATLIYIIEYKWIVPSIWAFRGKQMDLRNGSTNEEMLLKILQRLEAIEKKGGNDAKADSPASSLQRGESGGNDRP
jgi:hypothetical protein